MAELSEQARRSPICCSLTMSATEAASGAGGSGAGAAGGRKDGDETNLSGRQRVTETSSIMTQDIDVVGPYGIGRVLRQADAQIFAGWKSYLGMLDPEFLSRLDQTVTAAVDVLSSPDESNPVIVLTGCGTSGRMAYWCARAFNNVLARLGKPPRFKYLISGGDGALLLSDELPEDDPDLGARELKAATAGSVRSLFIGITCGISAAYVLGQVDYAMATEGMTTVLMGFNPPELARNMPVDGWGSRTCRDVAEALAAAADDDNILLTPVIGPEPITGSTRMKGGSATKIMLETIFAMAIRRLYGERVYPLESLSESKADTGESKAAVPDATRQQQLASVLQTFETTMLRTNLFCRDTGSVAELAGQSLKAGGHFYYLGGPVSGVLGLVDASEMPDTYGSAFDEVRGFTTNGWLSVGNATGDLREKGEFFRISHEDFKEDVLPGITDRDTVIVLGLQGEDSTGLVPLAELALAKGAKIALVWVGQADSSSAGAGVALAGRAAGGLGELEALHKMCSASTIITIPAMDIAAGVASYAEMALKWTLNAISTSAQITKGCVYTNRMINVGVLNNKLYYRAINLIRHFSGADFETARDCLLKVIHEVDELTDEIMGFTITKHIQVATDKSNVVPVSMLLATGKLTRVGAITALTEEPVLRNIVKRLAEQAAKSS